MNTFVTKRYITLSVLFIIAVGSSAIGCVEITPDDLGSIRGTIVFKHDNGVRIPLSTLLSAEMCNYTCSDDCSNCCCDESSFQCSGFSTITNNDLQIHMVYDDDDDDRIDACNENERCLTEVVLTIDDITGEYYASNLLVGTWMTWLHYRGGVEGVEGSIFVEWSDCEGFDPVIFGCNPGSTGCRFENYSFDITSVSTHNITIENDYDPVSMSSINTGCWEIATCN